MVTYAIDDGFFGSCDTSGLLKQIGLLWSNYHRVIVDSNLINNAYLGKCSYVTNLKSRDIEIFWDSCPDANYDSSKITMRSLQFTRTLEVTSSFCMCCNKITNIDQFAQHLTLLQYDSNHIMTHITSTHSFIFVYMQIHMCI